MIEGARRFVCVLSSIACLLCFVLLAGSGNLFYMAGMIAFGLLANWAYPMKWKWNRRGK